MTMSNGGQGGRNPLCTASNSRLQLIPQLQRDEDFVIGTMWSIRASSSAVIIFMLGFIADALTLHLRADNGMRISPPHWLCSFNPWNERLMQRHRGNQLFIYLPKWRRGGWGGLGGRTQADIHHHFFLVNKPHENTQTRLVFGVYHRLICLIM